MVSELLRLNPLQLTKDGLKGEKKGRFLVIQTLLGLGAMGYGYYLALSGSESSNGYYEFFSSCSTGHSRDLPSL